jgi:hypothetical protein
MIAIETAVLVMILFFGAMAAMALLQPKRSSKRFVLGER